MYRHTRMEGGRWKTLNNVLHETFPDGRKQISIEMACSIETQVAVQKSSFANLDIRHN